MADGQPENIMPLSMLPGGKSIKVYQGTGQQHQTLQHYAVKIRAYAFDSVLHAIACQNVLSDFLWRSRYSVLVMSNVISRLSHERQIAGVSSLIQDICVAILVMSHGRDVFRPV